MNISVIIPTYNRSTHILKALKSVQNQSLKAFEIIVVDDGSTDDTKEILKDKNIIYIRQENQGVSSARNAGIKNAKSDWIAFLDSDDIWDQNKLQEHKNLHMQHKTMLASFTNEKWIRNGKEIKLKNHQKKAHANFENSLSLCKIGASTFFCHKSLFKTVGYFDTNFLACEDYDLWLRILKQVEIYYIDKTLTTKYAGHEEQLSFTTKNIDIYRILALEKHIDSIYKKQVIEELLIKLNILIKGAIKHDNKEILEVYLPKLDYYNSLV